MAGYSSATRALHGSHRRLLLGVLALAALAALAAAGRATASGCAPAVSGISPASGFVSEATSVTISGTCFTLNGAVSSVTFAGTAASSFTVDSDTSVTAAAPAPMPAGSATVAVTAPGGTDTSKSFTYAPLPTASSISPALVFNDAATAVTVSGSGFAPSGGSTRLAINGSNVTTGTITNSSIAATAPAAATTTGSVSVSAAVTLNSVTKTTSVAGGLTYVALPSVSGIIPARGPEKGGTAVIVSGSGLKPPAGATITVMFGSLAAASVTQTSDIQLTAVTPAAPSGTGTVHVTVTVALPGGATRTSPTSSADQFTFVPAPTITSVSPNPVSSLTPADVTVAGTAFQDGAVILFGQADGSQVDSQGNPIFTGDLAATAVWVQTATTILATTPVSPPGATNVVVVNPDGQFGVLLSSAANHFVFSGAAPTISTLSATSGSPLGGDSITITGTNFQTGATVNFTSGASDPGARGVGTNVVSATSITTFTPAHAPGAVNLVVTNPDGGAASTAFTFNAYTATSPTITTPLSPASGPSNGGNPVSITGTAFTSGATVSFDGVPSPSAFVVNAKLISATAPAHAAGATPVSVTVKNPDGGTATAASAYTYTASPAPTLSGYASGSAITGPATGGTAVSLSGAGFAPGASVTFGGTAGTHTTASADGKTISTTTPPHAAGAVTVVVTNPDGQAATLSSTFTYTALAALSVTSLDVKSGGTLGNTAVVVTGAGFAPGATVLFGGIASPGGQTTVTDSSHISTVTPAGVFGTVSVAVRDPDATTATLANAFTFNPAPAPTIASVSPTTGAAGTQITITGAGFAHTSSPANSVGNARVTIGGQTLRPVSPATQIAITDTTITGVVPQLPGGAADIFVSNPDNQGVILRGSTTAAGPGYFYPSDTTPPTTTPSATANGSAYTFGAWATSKVIVTLAATDETGGSGVKQITYSAAPASGSTGQTIPTSVSVVDPSTVSITSDGKTVLTFFATDNAGNVETAQTRTIWVDRTPPSIVTAATIPALGGGSQAYTSGQVTNQDVTVTFSCSDATSGVSTLMYTLSLNTVATVSGTNPLAVTVNSAGANQSVTATCTDIAGNTTTSTFGGIDINKSVPALTASATAGGLPYTPGTWTNQVVTVTFACQPIVGGTQIASVSAPIQITTEQKDGTVTGTCTDQAGNSVGITFPAALPGIDIDMTLPLVTAVATAGGHPYVAGTWTNQSVTVTFSCTDPGSIASGVPPAVTTGLAALTAPVTVSAEGDSSGVIGDCTDAAGNEANPRAFFGPILIDKTPPSCTVSVNPNPIGPANGKFVNVTATVTVTDQSTLSGAKGFTLVSVLPANSSTGAADILGFTTSPFTTGQLRAGKGKAYILTYRASDVAGNVSANCSVKVTVH